MEVFKKKKKGKRKEIVGKNENFKINFVVNVFRPNPVPGKDLSKNDRFYPDTQKKNRFRKEKKRMFELIYTF